jgi:hypothetical protein
MIEPGSVPSCKDQLNLLKSTYKEKKYNIILLLEDLSKKEVQDIMQEVLIIKDKLLIFAKLNKLSLLIIIVFRIYKFEDQFLYFGNKLASMHKYNFISLMNKQNKHFIVIFKKSKRILITYFV